MSNLVMWGLVVGFLVPNLVAVIQQPRFTPPVRATITAVVSVIGGAGTAYFNGLFNPGDIVGSILICGVTAITFYKGFWKPTGIATTIENATSKTPPTVERLHPDDGPNLRPDPNVPRNDGGVFNANYALTVALLVLVVLLIIVVVVNLL